MPDRKALCTLHGRGQVGTHAMSSQNELMNKRAMQKKKMRLELFILQHRSNSMVKTTEVEIILNGSRTTPHQGVPVKSNAQLLPTRTTIPRTTPH